MTHKTLPALFAIAISSIPGMASAHDEIMNNTLTDSMVTGQILIQHSCDAVLDANGNFVQPEVIGFSFVFPTVEPVATRDDTGEAVDITAITQAYGGYLVTPFWDNRIFDRAST